MLSGYWCWARRFNGLNDTLPYPLQDDHMAVRLEVAASGKAPVIVGSDTRIKRGGVPVVSADFRPLLESGQLSVS